MHSSGLSEIEVEKIRQVFSKYNEIESVILYGSRATGKFEQSSDIDLTILGNNIDSNILSEVEFELDDLLLPYKIDINLFHRINNTELVDHIKRVGVVFYQV